MTWARENRLTLWQIIAGVAGVVCTALIHQFKDNSSELICAVIGISGAIIALGLEFFKAVSRQREDVKVFQDKLHDTLVHVSAITPSFKTDINDLQEQLIVLMQRFCGTVNDELLEGLVKPHRRTPIFYAWRQVVIEQAISHLSSGRFPLNKEDKRIDVLSAMIRVATHQILAFTYGTTSYFLNFWGDEDAMVGYRAAHSQALKNGVAPQRIFVLSDDVLTNQEAFNIFLRSLKDYWDIGMRHFFLTTEERLKRLQIDCPKSFLIVDDEFISQAEAFGLGSPGEVGLNKEDALALKRKFFVLRNAAGMALTESEINDPRLRLKLLGTSSESAKA